MAEDYEEQILYSYEDWVWDLLDTFIGVPVSAVKLDRDSTLTIRFADGRALYILDGPFENWHYSGREIGNVHGGMGRII